MIQADESSNALIISANDSVYNNLRGVIEKLDQRRAQVYVEALIVEVQTDLALQFGIQWAAGTPSRRGNEVGGSNGGVVGVQNFTAGPGIIETVVSQGTNLAGANGLTLGYLGREITLPDGTKARGLGALARALESNTQANVLSTPNLVTLDNAEAKIVVGQNVPFVTGSFAQATGAAGGTVNPFQTIERKDVGLTLKIKPQISEGGGVKLQISQEVSSVAQSAQSASDLITNKRSLDTTVIIDDGDTMVLGGLIENRSSNGVTQVPILGSIPIIGELFKFRNRSKNKTNLMIFLRPVIIHNADDTYRVTADRYDTIGADAHSKRSEQGKVLRRFKPVPPQPKPKEAEQQKPDTEQQQPEQPVPEARQEAPTGTDAGTDAGTAPVTATP
jgi:general secretion pathway protein D